MDAGEEGEARLAFHLDVTNPVPRGSVCLDKGLKDEQRIWRVGRSRVLLWTHHL